MDRLLEIFSKTTSKDVVIAIISFFNNLIPNVTKPESVNFLLSHPCILSLQNIKFLSLDNEIADYYINFLCILSQKIDHNSIHMFFNRVSHTLTLEIPFVSFANADDSILQSSIKFSEGEMPKYFTIQCKNK